MVSEKVLISEAYSLKGQGGIPLLVEIPLLKEHIPCVVSTAKPDVFMLVNKLSKEGVVRCGVFEHSSANHDRHLESGLTFIYDYLVSNESGNIFSELSKAVQYIRSNGDFSDDEVVTVSGPEFVASDVVKHLQIRHLPLNLSFDVVYSVPEFVGMSLVFPGNSHSGVIFHNIFKGLAFVDRNKSS